MNELCVDIHFQRNHFDLKVNFTLQKNRTTVILGPSGCGKSTLLRVIAGLEKVNNGEIIFQNNSWLDTTENINLSPQKRSVGFVFQDYALFEHMTVSENIGFSVDKKNRQAVALRYIEKMDLASLKDKYPSQLSGGQKQRVALGRALAAKPDVLLFDEPLSSIDFSLRKNLQREIKKYISEIDCPTLFVTHDLNEAKMMADELIVMENGKITRHGPAEQVLNNPVNKKSAKTLGWQNFIPIHSIFKNRISTNWGDFRVYTAAIPQAKWLSIKPEKIRFGKLGDNALPATVKEVCDYGIYKEFRCKIDQDLEIVVHRPADEPAPMINATVCLHLSAEHLILLNEKETVPLCFSEKMNTPNKYLSRTNTILNNN